MGIDAHVASSSAKRFALTIRYMLFGFRVSVLLCHTKVNDMDQVSMFAMRFSYQKVVRLDITVYQVLLMDGLDA